MCVYLYIYTHFYIYVYMYIYIYICKKALLRQQKIQIHTIRSSLLLKYFVLYNAENESQIFCSFTGAFHWLSKIISQSNTSWPQPTLFKIDRSSAIISNDTGSRLLRLAINVLKLQPNIDYSEIISLSVLTAHK